MTQNTRTVNIDEMREHKFLIATPCYGGNVTEPYLRSLMQLVGFAAKNDVSLGVKTIVNDSLVTRARNNMVASFMNSDFTHLVFIDADIEFDVEDFLRLYRANKDVVVGAYPKKRVAWEGVRRQLQDDPECGDAELEISAADFVTDFVYDDAGGQTVSVTDDGLIRVRDAGCGFMMIRRPVIEKMMSAYPELKYANDDPFADPAGALYHYALFDTMIEESSGRYLSEDYAFCRRWQAMGGTIWLDPAISLNHLGAYVFKGQIARYLKPS